MVVMDLTPKYIILQKLNELMPTANRNDMSIFKNSIHVHYADNHYKNNLFRFQVLGFNIIFALLLVESSLFLGRVRSLKN